MGTSNYLEHVACVERDVTYYASCACGWEGPYRHDEDAAYADCDNHEELHRES